MSDSRLEKFIYAICSMDVTDLPVPLSRIEKLWNCLITGETPDFEPLSRNEKYLMAMLDRYDISNLPAPMSRGEKLLYKIAVGETDLSDVPGYLSRYEELLKYLIENGGIGFEYVLYTLNQSLSALYSTAEKPVKSAILKGQTLVNLMNNTPIYENGNCMFELNYKVNEVTIFNYNNLNICCSFWDLNDNWLDLEIFRDSVIHINNPDKKLGCIQMPITDANITQFEQGKFVILEGNHTNKDIPYFGSMQSVRMPVLTTTGKNVVNPIEDLFVYRSGFVKPQVLFENGGLSFISEFNASICGFRLPVKLLKDEMYYVKCDYENMTTIRLYGSNVLSDEIDTTWETIVINQNGGCFSFNKQFDYYYVGFYPNQNSRMKIKNLQIEKGSIATPYEPYKTNILTVNEPVELRGIGDVQDTLDCLTGEMTERIGEIVLDGSEDWKQWWHLSKTVGFMLTIVVSGLNRTNSIANSLTFGNINGGGDANDIEGYNFSSGNILIRLNKTKLNGEFTDYSDEQLVAFKNYLSQNPITIQYQLATESIKTVDLTTVDQDGQPTKLKTFNDITYVEIKADNLIPSVDLEVATKINEALSTMGPQQLDISNTQNKLSQTIDEQSENTDATMMATTEIYEQTL